MNPPSQPEKQTQDLSWALLLSFTTVIVGSLCLLRYNVVYTEGEVMQWLFTILVGLVAACALLGFYRRKVAAWCIILLGGSLLLWQADQSREWAILHEEVVAIVRFAEETKGRTGHYPPNLDGYAFKDASVKSRIYKFESDDADGFWLSYFLNHTGITYWYSSKTGFGYYPD